MMRALLLSAMWTCSFAFAQSSVLFDAPVKITAEAKAGAGVTVLDLAMNQVTHEFRVTVLQRGNAAEALAAERARSGWKDGFLFIRDDCQPASEEKRAWRCVFDHVFTFVDAREGKRLVNVGEVFAGDDCVEEAKVGCSLYRGTFTDIYDALENIALVGRADSPALLIEMHVTSGEFVIDLDETWGRNQERFSAGERCLAARRSERAEFCTEGINPRRAYLFNSALAIYTKRADALQRIQASARTALCDEKSETECSEILRWSALILGSIKPGGKPRSRGNVQSVVLPVVLPPAPPAPPPPAK
ncbi:MAG: hypothetical protein ABI905_05025 [Betaproteobacteria bacterium]